MIFKRKRKEEQNIINCANLQYRKAVDTADLYMKSKEYTITEKQILLDLYDRRNKKRYSKRIYCRFVL